jgi:flagellar FliJ protein
MHKSPLSTLIELAINNVEQAAKNLGRAIRAKDDAEEQLRLLIQYRADYETRLQSNATQGLNVAQYINFQAFIGKMDLAVDGQKKIIQHAEYKVDLAQKHWQDCERKRLSYKTLIDRNAAVEQKKDGRRDQKQTDELATRTLFYKR